MWGWPDSQHCHRHGVGRQRLERGNQHAACRPAQQIERLHRPIGLDLGSKSPAEIALAVMADVLRVYRGKARDAL
ncbi:XdhC family protein [Pseudomonas sp. NY15374]|uniref:XdhC family protein n=1 Tax=Pseudomonas sp. NY15374 TaxID=3400357 RepID=UPI003A843A99